MTVLDYFVLIVVVVSVASGTTKGVLKGTISVLSAAAGLVSAVWCYGWAAKPFSLFASERAANLLGFTFVFVVVLLGGALLVRALHRGLKWIRLGWLDHALGAIFGLIRAWLICSAVYLALTAFPVRLSVVEQSMFAPALLEGTRVIALVASPQVTEQFMAGYAAVKRLWSEHN